MAELALVKKDGIIEKYGLGKYVHTAHSEGNVIFKDSFSSIERNSLGVETVALDDVKSDRVETMYPLLYNSFLTEVNPKTFFGRDWAGKFNIEMSVPAFAVYSLDSPYCEFWFANIRGTSKGFITPKGLPQIFLNSLLRMVSPLDGKNNVGKTHFISIFNGLIPSKVKEEIKNAKQYFGNQIYIVGEAKWTFKMSAPKTRVRRVKYVAPEKDPLVIGILNNSCYLISEFDTTPIEELVAKNYVKR